ncbi:MAG: YwaF family protein [Bacilli bacterium]|nr:YwaF family protein [Bacilli bacterium]
MLFDTTHVLYILFSLTFTITILILAKKYISKEGGKTVFLRFFGVGTFLLHISIIWVTYLQGDINYGYAYDNILFPIYFCNLAMYCLIICSFLKKETKFFKAFATFTAWAGIFGSLISLFYPDYYLHNPTLRDWAVLKSMLSHSTMLIGSLYLFVGNFVKMDLKNVLYFSYGLIGCLIVGLFNNLFLGIFDKNINSMYLKQPPLSDLPYLNFLTIPLLMLVIIFLSNQIKLLFQTKYKKQEAFQN